MASTTVSAPPERIWGALACPQCRSRVAALEDGFRCERCGVVYPTVNGVLDLRPGTAAGKPEETDWLEHWSSSKQQSVSQRFFSFYRKAVFARAVAYFVDRYLAHGGLLVEAGCGTAETSMLIDKRRGIRTLVALDLIRPVLERCHPVMDVRVSGDIFALPFQDSSIDGIWNVGVMEHFTHPQIDTILREFRRVLKPRGRVVLLWPAKFSIPQRILRILEWFINLRRGADRFRFHPDEISQLRSVRQGREVLTRNGFRPVAIDIGLRTLMAFETLIGERDAAYNPAPDNRRQRA
jgi:ubiquinone/menaquinone biosynthesis C-methylase UbiE